MRRSLERSVTTGRTVLLGLIALTVACSGPASRENAPIYDLVIMNGRVMDPASRLDASRNVGITSGTIRAVSEFVLRGRDTLDAGGMVVAPGFIDLHQHAQDTAAYHVEVLDGTTTALELEGGTVDIDHWYAERAGRSIINHGVSVGHDAVRMQVMHDPGTHTPLGPAKSRAMTSVEMQEMVTILDQSFRRGAVAAGMLIEFTPAATPLGDS